MVYWTNYRPKCPEVAIFAILASFLCSNLKVINHLIQLPPSHILFFTLPDALDTSFSMKKSLKVPKNTVVNHLKIILFVKRNLLYKPSVA